MKKTLFYAAIAAVSLVSSGIVSAAEIDLEKLQQQVEQQAAEIAKLKAQANGEAVLDEEGKSAEQLPTPRARPFNPLANVLIGSYGEMHYNNLKDDVTDAEKKEIDFHRFVLFVGYNFSERTRFLTELEFEHSVVKDGQPAGKVGEMKLEQAVIEHDLNQTYKVRGGLILVPAGIINERHEPVFFYGVERPILETQLIPSTWWEGGASLVARYDNGLGFDVMTSSALNMNPTTYNIRNSRQNVSFAVAEDLALTFRGRYTGINGLELAGTVQHGFDVNETDGGKQPGTLYTAHARYDINKLTLTAMGVAWHFQDSKANTLGKDKQHGYSLEASYKIAPKVGVFARRSDFDLGGVGAARTSAVQHDYGVNYWPTSSIVLKADYQDQQGSRRQDGLNLGIGYSF